ncbi:unnamed protein product [Pieris brassicae]|uniref:Uncharacterized protein n=1 Tax=Pieris brassicae TaxID=7116 RepID=A0A9P0T837_PIEBR|nr:unnamed protein product [Pieris brassicae]
MYTFSDVVTLIKIIIKLNHVITISDNIFTVDFDADYFFSALRTSQSCITKICQGHCGNKNSVCISGKCYCLENRTAANAGIKKESLYYGLRPTVRHHIAHFCPNLEVARSCIRKCMKEGLPSFCGKDHVCYCGHKYRNTDVNPEVNANQVHNQFKDLYAKYFGPDLRNKRSNLDESIEY